MTIRENELIFAYHKQITKVSSYDFEVDNQTSNDLQLNTLFEKLDFTLSPIGQQYLYSKLKIHDSLINNYKIISDDLKHIEENPTTQLDIENLFPREDCLELYYLVDFLFEKHSISLKHILFASLLVTILILFIFLTFLNPKFLIGVAIIVLINIFWYSIAKKYVISNFWAIKGLKIFKKIITNSANIASKFRFINNNLFKDTLIKASKINIFLWFIDVNKLSNNSFILDELKSFIFIIFEYIKLVFLVEYFAIYFTFKKIEKYRSEFRYLYESIGYIEYLYSIINYRKSINNYCIPVFTNTKSSHLILKGFNHPLINDCIPNDITITNNSIILGPNMSGKSTILKSIGTNMILAQSILTCECLTYESPFLKVISSLNISDNLIKGHSYFFSEVHRIKEIINKIEVNRSNKYLILIDEIFKGTNNIERLAGSVAVLKYLSKDNNFKIITTHDSEIANYLKSSYQILSFNDSLKNGLKKYIITKGYSNLKNGIHILKSQNFPLEIIKDAEDFISEINDNCHLN